MNVQTLKQATAATALRLYDLVFGRKDSGSKAANCQLALMHPGEFYRLQSDKPAILLICELDPGQFIGNVGEAYQSSRYEGSRKTVTVVQSNSGMGTAVVQVGEDDPAAAFLRSLTLSVRIGTDRPQIRQEITSMIQIAANRTTKAAKTTKVTA